MAKKIMMGTKLLLFLMLLYLASTQFFLASTHLNWQEIFTPQTTPASPTELIENDADLTINVPASTAAEEMGAGKPSLIWIGWVVIVVSSLLLLEGLDAKFLRSPLCLL